MAPSTKRRGRRLKPDVRQSLRRTFGLEQLRPGQAEVIGSVLEGHDTLAIMPTGAGKSLCYQLPALHLAGTTIIVSPLISLMKDQVDKLQDLGLEALQVNSTLTQREQGEAIHRIEQQRSDFVFTTPERLANPEFLATLRQTSIDFVVIDEAHCISQWGHDFRPTYLAIQQALAELGHPPVLALTATATEEVVEDIRRQLNRPEMRIYTTGIYRPNLHFEVVHVSGDEEKQNELIRLLEEIDGSGIVYTATVRHVDALVPFLELHDIGVVRYHGRMPARARKDVQDRFMAGEARVIVATNAFGMGIDKPDIGFVIHYDLPGTLEAYYQEAGRAGRDGEAARCALFYDPKDRRTQQFLMGGRYPSSAELHGVYEALMSLRGEGPVPLAQLQTTAAEVPKNKVRVVLSLMKQLNLVRELRGARFKLQRETLGSEELGPIAREWQERAEADREKLERMEAYARSARCRWRLLHDYFGEEMPVSLCGECDNCRKGLAHQAEPPINPTPAP
jgi:ATP-dependent DNA helicase RecQ